MSKETKDYETYFQPPSLTAAKKARQGRYKKILYDFEIPEEMKEFGMGKKSYHIKNYGCQMNEHDTETIMGMLEQMGYRPTDDREQADVILLNTCAIRENAEDKVFGELGHLKHLKTAKPSLILGVCGCMPQEEAVVNRILQKHPFVDLIFWHAQHTQTAEPAERSRV